jgi:peptidoglycan LD-endopeptidase CwlK
MPKFGKKSKERLEGVHPDIVRVLNSVIKYYDITILEGVRSMERQIELYNSGASKLDGVIRKSNHQTGKAVDISPWPVKFDDTKSFYYLAGLIKAESKKLGIRIRFGGDWNEDQRFSGRDPNQTFDDLVHYEVKL